MKQIFSIMRKELEIYLGSLLVIIFMGVFLGVTLFTFFNIETFFSRGIADIRPMFTWMPILLIFLLAAITMRQWSEEQRSGTMEMLLVRVAEARDDEVSLFAVFDSYDEALHRIYCALFNRDEEIRSSLGMDPFVHEVLFVRSLKLKPRWQGSSLGAQAIQTAASTLVTMGLVVANSDLGLSIDDWLNLGFVKIARQKGFFVCERTMKNRYGRAVLSP